MLLTKSLSPQDLDDHRRKVGILLEVMSRKMDRYGWDKMDSGVRTILRKDGMDALADYPLQEIQAARKQWVLENPSKMPNEGHIAAIINANRDKIRAAQPRATDVAQVRRATAEEDAAYAESVRGDVVNEEKKAKANVILAEVFGRMDINARH